MMALTGPWWRTARPFQTCQYEVSCFEDDAGFGVRLLSPTTGQIFLGAEDIAPLRTFLTTPTGILFQVIPVRGGLLTAYFEGPFDTGFGAPLDTAFPFSQVTLSWIGREEITDFVTDLISCGGGDQDYVSASNRENGQVAILNSARHDPDGPDEVLTWLGKIAGYAAIRNKGTDENSADIQWALTHTNRENYGVKRRFSWKPRW